MNNFETINNIQIITTKTSEEIKPQYLQNFILTTLNLNNIKFNEKSKAYYIFNKETSSYQIFISENEKVPLFLIFSLLNNSKNSLYYSKYFFCVYRKNKLIYLSKLDDEIKIEELKLYIEKKLNLKIEFSKFYKQDDLDELVLQFGNKNIKELENIPFIKKKVKNSFVFYLFYLFTLLCISLYMYKNYYKNTPEKNNLILKKNELLLLENKNKYKTVKYEINSLLKDLKKYKFILSSLVYSKKKFTLVFYSNNQKKIFVFLEKYSKNIISNSIKYQESNRYENSIIIKFN